METITPEFDYNLLRILIALDQTRNVSSAAELLGLSQSGCSTALARLRQKLNDPIFVRTPGGMVPTPRCERMLHTARSVVTLIKEGILEQPAFDPSTSTATFHLAMTDVAEIVFLPRLLRHLQDIAPSIKVTVGNYSTDTLKTALVSGEIDLVAGYFPELSGNGVFKQRFYTHTYACIVRKNHPVIKGKLTIKEYLSQGHAMVTAPARSIIFLEKQMEKKGIYRNIVLRTPHYLSLPAIIETTDLIATVPLAACASFALRGQLQLLRTPFTPPSFPVQQHWHRKVHNDPRHKWLRAQMALLFNESEDEWRAIESELYGKNYRGSQLR
ncbi:LysR family transcriptional regulator [Polaromonas sp.]|uniref:LysR family transcriptional regulator n=1 Tax=Polaromonas sp. TaxID=1869339 RepID=UPI003265563B